jgi:hypothetical protein
MNPGGLAASPTTVWIIHNKRRKAAAGKRGVPAFPAIGGCLVSLAYVTAAMNHDYWISVLLRLRNLILHVGVIDEINPGTGAAPEPEIASEVTILPFT